MSEAPVSVKPHKESWWRKTTAKIKGWHDAIWYKNVTLDLSNAQDKSALRTIRKRRTSAYVVAAVLILLVVISLLSIDLNDEIPWNWGSLGDIIGQLFKPGTNSTATDEGWWHYCLNTGFGLIWRTIEMTFLATFVGAILSVPLMLLSASNIARKAWIYQPTRAIQDVIRTIPTLVLAILATAFFGLTELSGILAMTIFTIGIMYKLMYEYIETIEMSPFEAMTASGATALQATHIGLHPEIKPMFLSYSIYTFEINIRASVVLGFVGAGGFGAELQNVMEERYYDKVGGLLVPLFIVVVFLQVVTNVLERKLR